MSQGHGLLVLQREMHVNFVSGYEFKGRDTLPATSTTCQPCLQELSGLLCQLTDVISTAHSELFLEMSLKAATCQCRKQESPTVESLQSRPRSGPYLGQCFCYCLHKVNLPLQMSAITRKATNQKKVLQIHSMSAYHV